jgi:hypothetical protein
LQRHIFTTVFNKSFNCLPDGPKNFQKKTYWLLENKENYNFERQLILTANVQNVVLEHLDNTLSAESFFKTLIALRFHLGVSRLFGHPVCINLMEYLSVISICMSILLLGNLRKAQHIRFRIFVCISVWLCQNNLKINGLIFFKESLLRREDS